MAVITRIEGGEKANQNGRRVVSKITLLMYPIKLLYLNINMKLYKCALCPFNLPEKKKIDFKEFFAQGTFLKRGVYFLKISE